MSASVLPPVLPPWVGSTLWPGASVVAGGERRAAAVRLLALPTPAAPTQLLPRRLTTAIAARNRRSDDRHPLRGWVDAAALAAMVLADRVDGRRGVSLERGSWPSLVDHLRDELDPAITGALVLCGPPRANQKPVLQLHDRRGRTVAFVKVAWNELTSELLDQERQALDHLASISHPGFTAPTVLGAGTHGDGRWLAISPMSVRRRRPASPAATIALAQAIEASGERVETTTASAPFVSRLLAAASTLPAAGPAVQRLLDRHGARPMSVGGCHGDFVPWNVLTGASGAAVWDWERYETSAPVGFDRIHRAFQLSIQREGRSVGDGVVSVAGRLAGLVPEHDGAMTEAHLDWYLAHLLCRYEHDAQTNPTRKLLDRASTLVVALEDRWKARTCR